MPRYPKNKRLSPGERAALAERARAALEQGHTRAQIARATGRSYPTIQRLLRRTARP
ncbi:helix-turn-helix domain-containing protein [Streptomyces specialis]|uniref:helix-turn-helix domain-containing protein n=1 Tax=Streptomyces specialis TaxID=498367 RepID=UPI000D150781